MKNPAVFSLTTVLAGMAAMVCAAELASGPVARDTAPSAPVSTSESVDDQTAPVLNWTEFIGTVSYIDLRNKIVQIRETSTDTLIDVPVSQNVSIYKRDRKSALGDLKEGDTITIRNDAAS